MDRWVIERAGGCGGSLSFRVTIVTVPDGLFDSRGGVAIVQGPRPKANWAQSGVLRGAEHSREPGSSVGIEPICNNRSAHAFTVGWWVLGLARLPGTTRIVGWRPSLTLPLRAFGGQAGIHRRKQGHRTKHPDVLVHVLPSAASNRSKYMVSHRTVGRIGRTGMGGMVSVLLVLLTACP